MADQRTIIAGERIERGAPIIIRNGRAYTAPLTRRVLPPGRERFSSGELVDTSIGMLEVIADDGDTLIVKHPDP